MTPVQQRLLETVAALVLSLAEEAKKLDTANKERLNVDMQRVKAALMPLNATLAAR